MAPLLACNDMLNTSARMEIVVVARMTRPPSTAGDDATAASAANSAVVSSNMCASGNGTGRVVSNQAYARGCTSGGGGVG